MSEVYSLVYKPADENAPDHYSRVPLKQATLVVAQGIEGDLSGQGNPNRQLNIMAYETLQALGGDGFMTQPGQMGEQITLRGLNVDALAAGTRLQLGDSAVIEIVKPRTGCDRFEAIQGRKRTEVAGKMGMMAQVITGGALRVGDAVTVLETIDQ